MHARLVRFFHVLAGPAPLPFIYLISALLLGIFLQLQFSFFKEAGYLGLRLNAADLLLPILGLVILFRLITKKNNLPQWRVPGMYAGLGVITVIMTIALINGHNTTGAWNTWAIINKYIGWYVLMAYLGLGGWIASRKPEEWVPAIETAFLAGWIFSLILMTGRLMYIDLQGNSHQILLNYPLSGFMGNRNAYAFLSFSMLALMTALRLRKSGRPGWGLGVVWALMPIFYAYNASRAGMVILVFLILVFTALNFRFSLRHILLPFLVGSLATFAYFSSFNSYALQITHANVDSSAQLMAIGGLSAEEAQEKINYVGDKVRMDTYGDALELWKHYPLLGGGLGAFRDYQTDKRGKYSDIIDCTALWLLSETGAVGLGLFSVFFLLAMWKIFIKIKAGEDTTGIYLGIILMMMIFGIMSLVHELLYTRFLWFFMGLGLALPLAEQKSKTHPA